MKKLNKIQYTKFISIFYYEILFLCIEHYYWEYGVIRKSNFSMAHLNGH